MLLLYVCSAWLAGVRLGWSLPFLSIYGWPLLIVAAGTWRAFPSRSTRLVIACLTLVVLGALRVGVCLPHPADPGRLEHYASQTVELTGVVAEEPVVRDLRQIVELEAESVRQGSTSVPVSGRGTLTLRAYPRLEASERVQVSGRLVAYSSKSSPVDRLTLSYPTVITMGRDSSWSPMTDLRAFRRHARSLVTAILPEPEAGLLAGILLGATDAVSSPIMADFKATGTSHLIVISGYNLALLCATLCWFANRWLPRHQALLVAMPALALYTILVGAGPAVLRAGLMASLAGLAVLTGRRSNGVLSLAAAAAAMTAFDPTALWDIGFQLSFAATAGLILFSAPLETAAFQASRHVRFLHGFLALLRESLIATVAAQIFTLPLIIFHFRQLSLIMLPANLLVLPAQPALMAAGAAALVAAWVWLPAGYALGAIAWLFLTFTIRVVEAFATLPWASIDTGPIPPGLLIGYFAIVAVPIWMLRQPRSVLSSLLRRIRRVASLALAPAVLATLAALLWAAVFSMPDRRLHVRFLDVGQGDAALVTTPDGHQIVIDGGPSPGVFLSGLGRAMPFWDRDIDLVVLSHADQDHLAGLVSLAQRYRIGAVIQAGRDAPSVLFEEWQTTLADKEVPVYEAVPGLRVQSTDGVGLEVLSPAAGRGSGPTGLNAVVRLSYGQVSALFTGDMDATEEQDLLASGRTVSCTLLKVAHHGSGSSTSETFLHAVQPQAAIISVGHNSYGHPSDETIERLSGVPTLRTDQSGAIEVACAETRCDIVESR